MAFKKGDPKPKNSGIKKGQSRKETNDLRAMVFGALNAKGGQEWIERLMDENPTAYATLLGKFVPKDVNVGGQPDNPIQTVTKIKLIPLE